MTSRACDACRFRKVKCSNLIRSSDTCDGCARVGLTCTYQRPVKQRGPVRGRRVRCLQRAQASGFPEGSSPSSSTASDRDPEPRGRSASAAAQEADQHHGYVGDLPGCVSSAGSTAGLHASTFPPLQNASWDQFQSTGYLPLNHPPMQEEWLTSQHVPQTVSPTSEGARGKLLQAFDKFIVIFPVASRHRVVQHLDSKRYLWDPHFKLFLRLVQLWQTIVAFRRDPAVGSNQVHACIRSIESERNTYDFSECPSTYAVAASLVLFSSYNVLDRHNRAFLYLSEAISIREMIDLPADDYDKQSLQCLDYVLYNTELVSLELYGDSKRRARAARPTYIPSQPSDLIAGPPPYWKQEVHALDLLLRLTRVNCATEISHLIGSSPVANWKNTGDNGLDHSGCTTILQRQTADTEITRVWRLSSRLAALCNPGTTTTPNDFKPLLASVCELGTSAASWASSLQEGDLRVVGLGKLAVTVRNLLHIERLATEWAATTPEFAGCGLMLTGLVDCIIKGDYEMKFSDMMASSIMSLPLNNSPPLSIERVEPDPRHEDGWVEPPQPVHPFTGFAGHAVV